MRQVLCKHLVHMYKMFEKYVTHSFRVTRIGQLSKYPSIRSIVLHLSEKFLLCINVLHSRRKEVLKHNKGNVPFCLRVLLNRSRSA